MKRRKRQRIDSFKEAVEAELLSLGWAPFLIEIILPLIKPLVLRLLNSCANRDNPKILQRRANAIIEGSRQIADVYKARLAQHVSNLPVSLTDEQLNQFCMALVKTAVETSPEDYHVVAQEVEFVRGA